MGERGHESGSEVARIRQQITTELESMQRCFSAFASGVARHDFIRTRMERVGERQEELASHLGADNAARVVCELYISTVKCPTSKDGGL